MTQPHPVDVVLIGSGIMSATLGILLQQLRPDLRIVTLEALPRVAAESTDAWNNAGTGHAAFCELNYTPQLPDGSVQTTKAIQINEQFQHSLQLWSTLVQRGIISAPADFIHRVPHMSFVSGAPDVTFLHRRFEALQKSPLFSEMRYTEDPAEIAQWAPLMMQDRAPGPVAATRVDSGTDVDFGALTRKLFVALTAAGAELLLQHRVTRLRQNADRIWQITARNLASSADLSLTARFVFVGAGGGALTLLQQAGIPEGRGYGGFPVSGQWLRCTNPALADRHQAKVYGKAAVGAPPMSVPHLDLRLSEGKKELLFGPYAGFSTKFLKTGSYLDLVRSVRPNNLYPLLKAGADNMSLSKYLVGQVMQSPQDRFEALKTFIPDANISDWKLEIAGQRVQIIKRDPKRGGILEFGTEIIRSADGSIAALLGASPGASTAVSIMLNLLEKGIAALAPTPELPTQLRTLIPTYGQALHQNPAALAEVRTTTRTALQLS